MLQHYFQETRAFFKMPYSIGNNPLIKTKYITMAAVFFFEFLVSMASIDIPLVKTNYTLWFNLCTFFQSSLTIETLLWNSLRWAGVFENRDWAIGAPDGCVFFFGGKSELQMDDDWRYPYFRKPPYVLIWCLCHQRFCFVVAIVVWIILRYCT